MLFHTVERLAVWCENSAGLASASDGMGVERDGLPRASEVARATVWDRPDFIPGQRHPGPRIARRNRARRTWAPLFVVGLDAWSPQSTEADDRMLRRTLVLACLALSSPTGAQTPFQTIRPTGMTPSLAQTMDWLDAETFAVGRWDGSISLFRTPSAGESGPVMVGAAVAPSGRGVEMLGHIDGMTLVSSDGPGKLVVWRRSPGGSLTIEARPTYDAAFGTANSGVVVQTGAITFFVSGQEDGHVLIWRWSGTELSLVKVVDVRSKAPAANPFGIHNVRGMKPWRSDLVVTGSEDGDLVGLKLPDGTEVFRTRFNEVARRGINSISVFRDMLMVANCAVGGSDKNVGLYDLSSGEPKLLDAENLEVDMQRPQVFDFNAVLTPTSSGDLDFFASTEEGLLWRGRIQHGQMVMSGVTKVSTDGAAIIASSPNGGTLATASASIRLFKTD